MNRTGYSVLLSGLFISSLSPVLAKTRRNTTVHHPHRTGTPAPAGTERITVSGHEIAGTSARYLKPVADMGPLGNRKLLDTPFSVMGVTGDVIANQQVRNINDLMKYLPSVQLEIRGDANTSRPQSRGFESDVVSNMRIDGLNAVSTTPYAGEQFDGLEVLNGVGGALYGPQNPAGTFSYSLKKPTDKNIRRLTLGIDSKGAVMEEGDLSGRAGKNGWFGYRLNLLNGDGTGYVKQSWLRRGLVDGEFDFRITPSTRIEVGASQYSYAQRGFAPGFAYGTTLAGTDITQVLPAAPDLSKPHMSQDYAGYNATTNIAHMKIYHQISENWKLTLGGLYQNAHRQNFGTTDQLTDNEGGYRQTISAAATAKNFRVGSNLAYINGHVKTWFIGHDIVIGTNGYMMGNYNPTSGQSFVLGTGSIYDPQAFEGHQPHYSGHYQSAYIRSQSMIVGDTLHFDRHWSIMGTLSWSWIHAHNYSWNTALGRAVTKSTYSRAAAFSPSVSLLYKPAENQTAYFTWSRSVTPGDTAPTSAENANEILTPYKNEEYEVGYKFLLWNRLMLNAAGFRMTRPAPFTDPVTHIYGAFGQQRNYGVEFQASGSITKNLSVLAGVTWLDAQLGNTGTASTSHKQVVGVPPVQANVLLDWRLPLPEGSLASGLAVNANVHYTGRRAANVYNTTFAGSYVLLDLGVRYPFHVRHVMMTARLGVNNVTNERYWASVYPSSTNGLTTATNSAYAGMPRTWHFTVEADF
ncbi:TonB-dependent receptor [Acetobacter sp. AN02]|uniref:TonB-dependent receptor n=1 Tax=Acetobacter sp. AN02 TaxID=2894186 RepID=UPI0024341BF0|nr:TonB-dependent receptor [Acetobacter sp. AN02]MDG6094807.1 TonB-dependent receptor [Acetobacter sp. AN02]